MTPKLVEHDGFLVVGVAERFLPGKLEGMAALWDRVLPRASEISGAIDGVHYGVYVPEPAPGKALTSSPFTYVAGVSVTAPAHAPDGMTLVTVPAATYAVVTHRGPLSELTSTIVAFWREGMPAAGLTPTGGPDFEVYDHRFHGERGDSEIDLYVPVTRA